jgi:hypothetical protein
MTYYFIDIGRTRTERMSDTEMKTTLLQIYMKEREYSCSILITLCMTYLKVVKPQINANYN